MPRKASASNATVQAVEQVAALYGVRSYRMNSRAFMVPGAGGKERPMFMGQWKDENGEIHRKGMGDLLLTPQVPVSKFLPTHLVHIPMNNSAKGSNDDPKVTVALWVECKSGTGRLETEQKKFRDDVTKAGAFYIEAHDSADSVLAWMERMGVRR